MSTDPSPIGRGTTGGCEQEFQQLVVALKANDAERQSATIVYTEQGIGDNPTGAAKFMRVLVEQAAEA